MGKFKYGLMVMSQPFGEQGEFEIAPGATTFIGNIDSLFEANQLALLQERQGTTEWDRIRGRQRICLIRTSSLRPHESTPENDGIQLRIWRMRQALLLASSNGFFFGHNWTFDGQAAGPHQSDKLLSVQTTLHFTPLVRPFYERSQPYMRGRVDEVGNGWLNRWRESARMLEAAPLPRILSFAMISFERAFEPLLVEFKIPDAVRAIEAVIALPKENSGAANFATRVLALVPEVRSDWYVGGPDIEERLKQLYRQRNEGVHGKVPFESLEAEGDDGVEEVARLEYLAEFVARQSLVKALRHPNMREVFADRKCLETAWAERRFPE